MRLNNWVIMNTKQKMTLQEAAKWYESNELTIIHGARCSNRGAYESIYIIGAGNNCYGHKGEMYNYTTDTGNGYGGTGVIKVYNVTTHDLSGKIMSVEDIMQVNEKRKLPVWVFK